MAHCRSETCLRTPCACACPACAAERDHVPNTARRSALDEADSKPPDAARAVIFEDARVRVNATGIEIRHEGEDAEGRLARRTMILAAHVTSIGTWERARLWAVLGIGIILMFAGLMLAVLPTDPSESTRKQVRDLREQVEILERAADVRPDLFSRARVREVQSTLDKVEADARTPFSYYLIVASGAVFVVAGIVMLIVFLAIPPKFSLRMRAAGGEDETLESRDRAWRDSVAGAIIHVVDEARA